MCTRLTIGKFDNRAGWNFDYILIDRAGVGDETEVKELGDGARINLAGKAAIAQRPRRRSKRQLAIAVAVKQRFDAEVRS